MIVEDVHWSDPTSLEAFGRAVDWIASHRVLLLVTFRPEFEPPWIGRPYVTFIAINRLGEREVAAIVDGVTGFVVPPDDLAAMRTALVTLCTDDALAAVMGKAARARMLEHFEWSSVVKRCLEAYRA